MNSDMKAVEIEMEKVANEIGEDIWLEFIAAVIKLDDSDKWAAVFGLTIEELHDFTNRPMIDYMNFCASILTNAIFRAPDHPAKNEFIDDIIRHLEFLKTDSGCEKH